MLDPLFINDYYFPAFVLITLSILIILDKEKIPKVPVTIIDVIVFLFALYFILRKSIYAPLTPNIYDFYYLISYLLIYLCAKILYIQNRVSLRLFSILILIIFVFEGICVFAQLVEFQNSRNTFFKITGSFVSPAILTNFLCISFPLINEYLIKKGYPILAKLTLALLAIICFATDSKLSWLVLGIFVIYKLVSNVKRIPAYVYIMALMAIVAIIYAISLQDSTSGRFLVLRTALSLLSENLISGVGIDQFDAKYNLFQGKFLLSQNNATYNYMASYIEVCYNDFLQTVIEIGLVGIVFIVGTATVIYKRFKCYENYIKESIIIIISIALFSFPFQTSSSAALCIFYLGIISTNHSPLLNINAVDKITRGSLALISILFVILLFEIQNALFIWRAAKQDTGITSEEKFIRASGVLSNNKDFQLSYANLLYLKKSYMPSIALLERAGTQSSKLDIFLLLALNYDAIGNTAGSEQNYKKCILLVPSLLKPKFLLMKLYLQNKRLSEAQQLARSIIGARVKVNNQEAAYFIKMSKKVIALKQPAI
jgi:tetratricopeptide (TPR) repeat protein